MLQRAYADTEAIRGSQIARHHLTAAAAAGQIVLSRRHRPRLASLAPGRVYAILTPRGGASRLSPAQRRASTRRGAQSVAMTARTGCA